MEEKLLDAKKTSSLLGCTEATLALWRRIGQGPSFVRVGRLVRYRERDLVQWIEQQTVSRGIRETRTDAA